MPLKTSDGIGTWIKDFKKSKAPQFKGKSKEKRRQQAIAAYLSAKDGGRNEEKMKTFSELREEISEGKYVGGPKHTWPQYIGANNSPQAKKIKTALKRAGHSFKDHGDLPANKKANHHYISMKDKAGYDALMKLNKG